MWSPAVLTDPLCPMDGGRCRRLLSSSLSCPSTLVYWKMGFHRTSPLFCDTRGSQEVASGVIYALWPEPPIKSSKGRGFWLSIRHVVVGEKKLKGSSYLTSGVWYRLPRSAQSSSCTSSCSDIDGRPASLTRLAMMSHWGVRDLDLVPAEEEGKLIAHGRLHQSKPTKDLKFITVSHQVLSHK